VGSAAEQDRTGQTLKQIESQERGGGGGGYGASGVVWRPHWRDW